jgi:hypothetical protein
MSNYGGNMLNRIGWMPITCEESDSVRKGLTPASSLTDLDGEFGEPVIYTEWYSTETNVSILRDYRWFDGRPCEHLVVMASA